MKGTSPLNLMLLHLQLLLRLFQAQALLVDLPLQIFQRGRAGHGGRHRRRRRRRRRLLGLGG
ncbi:MAG TPA: hypothetical protein VM469_14880, partial [Pseudoxanthomonas sp.]|nr:hypothetical protein [Pseudoxanthomonas sp.]